MKMRLAAPTLVLLSLMAAGCAEFGDFSEPARLTGQVLSYPGGIPVAGANVVATGGQAATSDREGRFTLDKLADLVTLTLFHASYQPVTQRLALDPGHERAATFYLPLTGAELPDLGLLFVRAGRIWESDPYGLHARCLTVSMPGEQSSPAWRADHRHFTFLDRIDGRAEAWEMGSDGSDPERLSTLPDSTGKVLGAPEGDDLLLTFASHGARGVPVPQLEVLDAAGNPQASFSGGVESDPAWAPDGRFIAWARLIGQAGTWQLWTADPAGGTARAIVTGMNAREPAWSPDGTSIAFASDWLGAWQIYVVSAEGGAPRQLTHVPAGSFCHHPSWAPTGDQIAFESDYSPELGTTTPDTGLYAVDVRGDLVSRMVKDAGSPSW